MKEHDSLKQVIDSIIQLDKSYWIEEYKKYCMSQTESDMAFYISRIVETIQDLQNSSTHMALVMAESGWEYDSRLLVEELLEATNTKKAFVHKMDALDWVKDHYGPSAYIEELKAEIKVVKGGSSNTGTPHREGVLLRQIQNILGPNKYREKTDELIMMKETQGQDEYMNILQALYNDLER